MQNRGIYKDRCYHFFFKEAITDVSAFDWLIDFQNNTLKSNGSES